MADSLSSSMQGVAAESGKAVGSAMKGAGGGDDQGVTELYKINQIWYRVPPTLSLVSKRTLLVNNAMLQQYPTPVQTHIRFIFNTGEYYTNMPSSWMLFKMGWQNTTTTNFNKAKAMIAQGNVASMFEEITLSAASGTEICREQNKGLRESFKFYYTNCQEYIDTFGQAQGATYGKYSSIHDGAGPTLGYSIGQSTALSADVVIPQLGGCDIQVLPSSGEAARNFLGYGLYNLVRSGTYTPYTTGVPDYLSFVIPMDQVLGCFKPYMQCLFPAGALAGATLDIQLKNPIESLQFVDSVIESAVPSDVFTPGNLPGGAPPAPAATKSTALDSLTFNNGYSLFVSNVYMMLDAFQLQDSVLRRLNQIASGQDGLSLLFDTYDHTQTLVQGSGTSELQVQQARSRMIRSWCVVRDSQNIGNAYVNSLASEAAVQRACASCPQGYVPQLYPLTAHTGAASISYNNTGVSSTTSQLTCGVQEVDGNNYWGIAAPTVPTSAAYTNGFYTFGQYPIFRKTSMPADIYLTNWGVPTVTSYQAQLGSLFFPNQPFTRAIEYYSNALYMWGKSIPDRENNCAVSFMDFLGGQGAGLYDTTTTPGTIITQNPTNILNYGKMCYPYGLAIYGMLAEKSSNLQLSGLPISNARLLRHKFTFGFNTLSTASRQINCFTDFTRMFKVFLGGRVVVRE